MTQRIAIFLAGVALAGLAWAGTPEAQVQGLYEGTGKDATGECKIEARVAAQGGGVYKVFVRQEAGGKLTRAELEGKTAGEAITFASKPGGVEWKGAYADGGIKGTCGAGTFEIKRVERKSPTLGQKPPEGAIVILDGKEFSEIVRGGGAAWNIAGKDQPAAQPAPGAPAPTVVGEDGSIQVTKGGMNSKRQFDGSFNYHVEFMTPLVPTAHSQGRGNSGVFLPNGDEIQVLDSFGDVTYLGGGCGGLYRYKDPDTMEIIESLKDKPEHKFSLASLPPLCWQTYDVEYRVEKKDGQLVGKPRVTVLHNGIKIHDNVELNKPAKKGGFNYQDHGNPVRYRNIWVVPVEQK